MIILPLYIALDWDKARSQAQGTDLDSTGIDPYSSLQVRFISAAGVEYGNGFNPSDHPESVVDGLPDPALWNLGSIYPPAQSVTAYVYASVPKDQVEGGAWKVSNSRGDAVFLAL